MTVNLTRIYTRLGDAGETHLGDMSRVAKTHPRIEAPTLAQLLAAAGYSMPVVDIDRVTLRYASLDKLVCDLRSMGATSVLAHRPPALTKKALTRARKAFVALASGEKTEEIVEILHFLAWNQQSRQARN